VRAQQVPVVDGIELPPVDAEPRAPTKRLPVERHPQVVPEILNFCHMHDLLVFGSAAAFVRKLSAAHLHAETMQRIAPRGRQLELVRIGLKP
jgi:hypothetical protein